MRPRQAAPYGPAPGSIPAGRRTVLLPPGGENESSPTYHMSSRLKHTLDNRPLLKMHYRGGNLGDQLFEPPEAVPKAAAAHLCSTLTSKRI